MRRFVLVVPLLATSFLGHAWVLGYHLTLEHFVCGLMIALMLLEGLFLGYRKLPFASNYVPTGNLQLLSLLYVAEFSLTVFGLAWIERLALGNSRGFLFFVAPIATLLVGIRAVHSFRGRLGPAIDLDELPAAATQRLDLVR